MKIPNTISDEQMKKLSERAEKVAPPMFSDEAIKKSIHHNKQKDKADQS